MNYLQVAKPETQSNETPFFILYWLSRCFPRSQTGVKKLAPLSSINNRASAPFSSRVTLQFLGKITSCQNFHSSDFAFLSIWRKNVWQKKKNASHNYLFWWVVFTEDSSCFNANFCKHFNPMTRFDALLVNIPPKLWDIFFWGWGWGLFGAVWHKFVWSTTLKK